VAATVVISTPDRAREAETTLARAEHCVEFIFEALKSRLLQSGRMELRGFGILVIQTPKRGVGRNPRTVLPRSLQAREASSRHATGRLTRGPAADDDRQGPGLSRQAVCGYGIAVGLTAEG
jgi:nucleoid DNA-binding protein